MSRRFLHVPDTPLDAGPIRLGPATTPARLTLSVMGAARRYTIPATALAVTHQIGEALVPVLVGVAIERAVSTGDPAQLVLWLALLAADFALLSFSWRFGSRFAELGRLVVQHRLRTLVAEHLVLRAPGGRRASNQPGVALSLATADVNRLSGAVEVSVFPVGQFAAVLFGGIVLLTLSWPLGLAVLVGAPLLLGATEFVGRGLQRASGDEQASAAAATGRAADLLAGYRVIRGIGDTAADEAVRRYRSSSRDALDRTLHARRADGIYSGAMSMATGLFVAGVSIAAAVLALTGGLGVGEFITVVGLTQFLIEPLQYAARAAGSGWATAKASAARLLALIGESEGGDADGPSVAGRRTDADADGRVLQARSFAATVSHLTPGALVVVSADHEIEDALVEALRVLHPDALFAPRAAHLFPGSVRDNLALPGTEESDIERALTAAGCDELIENLPRGLDTEVGTGGSALSGGQRQRIALARALAQHPPLIVLHDPLTAVDTVTEAAVATRIRGLRREQRTIVITRSPAFAAVADRIVGSPSEVDG